MPIDSSIISQGLTPTPYKSPLTTLGDIMQIREAGQRSKLVTLQTKKAELEAKQAEEDSADDDFIRTTINKPENLDKDGSPNWEAVKREALKVGRITAAAKADQRAIAGKTATANQLKAELEAGKLVNGEIGSVIRGVMDRTRKIDPTSGKPTGEYDIDLGNKLWPLAKQAMAPYLKTGVTKDLPEDFQPDAIEQYANLSQTLEQSHNYAMRSLEAFGKALDNQKKGLDYRKEIETGVAGAFASALEGDPDSWAAAKQHASRFTTDEALLNRYGDAPTKDAIQAARRDSMSVKEREAADTAARHAQVAEDQEARLKREQAGAGGGKPMTAYEQSQQRIHADEVRATALYNLEKDSRRIPASATFAGQEGWTPDQVAARKAEIEATYRSMLAGGGKLPAPAPEPSPEEKAAAAKKKADDDAAAKKKAADDEAAKKAAAIAATPRVPPPSMGFGMGRGGPTMGAVMGPPAPAQGAPAQQAPPPPPPAVTAPPPPPGAAPGPPGARPPAATLGGVMNPPPPGTAPPPPVPPAPGPTPAVPPQAGPPVPVPPPGTPQAPRGIAMSLKDAKAGEYIIDKNTGLIWVNDQGVIRPEPPDPPPAWVQAIASKIQVPPGELHHIELENGAIWTKYSNGAVIKTKDSDEEEARKKAAKKK